MSLRVFDTLDFSDKITINKKIPSFKKIELDVDVAALLKDYNNFCTEARFNAPEKSWFATFGVDITSAKEDLNKINFLKGYRQWQMTTKQPDVPWQTFLGDIGDSTKTLFNNELVGFHRPRYIEASSGWNTNQHIDWNNNKKLGLRFHLILETNDECKHFITGEDGTEYHLHFQPGELWFYNIELKHRAENLGTTVRKSITFELFNDDLL